MEPVLFIHGLTGWRFHYFPLENYLKKKGIRKIYEFNYEKRFGEVSLREIARDLNKFIKERVKEKKIIIIGLSQGGLIANYYVQNYKNPVNKCISICTPFKGVWWASLLSRPGLKDLRLKSDFVKEIESNIKKERKKTKVYSIWTPFDLIAFPGWNSKLQGSKSKMVLAPGHHLAFWSLGTKRAVWSFLKSK